MSIPNDTHIGEEAGSQTFSFQPPAGGDIVLKSCDGTTFNAHSVILGMASTVFGGMFYGATKPDPIELAEDAESISLMLAFIYPVAPPHINTIDHLEKIMKVSQKYDVERMTKFIEEAVTLGSKLMTLDPMRVFYLCVTHNFPAIQALTAESFRPKSGDLLTVDGLLQLAKYFPQAAPVIGLVGAQGARVKILDQVLIWSPQEYGCYQLSALGDDKNHGAALPVCPSHAHPTSKSSHGSGSGVPGTRTTRVPDYCIVWLRQLYDELLEKPMHECNDLFRAACLANFSTQICIGCVAVTIGKKDIFEQWALNVKQIVRNELEVLDPLYSL
ncbi:BTB domain-containing protein [Rhizoctonia solani AG-1 IA]|uniref:BTB domain-containing protein n=2 Tax=Rhizoctonia solani TaxID=456999 RepID=L8X4B7_THACA|nr:BTB domain-containing protein [Rhizoctonia solani AG-1 IA]